MGNWSIAYHLETLLGRLQIDPDDIPENVCWLRLDLKRRPMTRWKRKPYLTYRFLYEYFIGPLRDDVELHHTCEQSQCCNPWHCDTVTSKEHKAFHPQKRPLATYCRRGHEYTPDNTIHRINKRRGKMVAFRLCRQCRRITARPRLRPSKENTDES